MPKVEPVVASGGIYALLHTDIGWGKTSWIGSGGHDFRILIMRPPTDHVEPILGSGCHQMVVRNWDDTFEGLDYIRHNAADWDFFAMDSISLLQDIGLDDVYEGVLDMKGAPGTAARKHREKFGPDQGEYRVNMWRLGQWIRKCVSEEQVNLIITAHSFWWDPPSSEIQAGLWPWIQGKNMPSKICGMMNIVGYGDLREVSVRGQKRYNRVIHWDKTPDWYAKNQFKVYGTSQSVFPTGESVNQTLPQFVEAINKSRPATRGTRRPSGRPSTGRPSTTGGRPSRRS